MPAPRNVPNMDGAEFQVEPVLVPQRAALLQKSVVKKVGVVLKMAIVP